MTVNFAHIHVLNHSTRLYIEVSTDKDWAVEIIYCRLPTEISFTAAQDQDFKPPVSCKEKARTLGAQRQSSRLCRQRCSELHQPWWREEESTHRQKWEQNDQFDRVPVNGRTLGRISLYKNGQYALQYRWVLSEKCLVPGRWGEGLWIGLTSLVSIDSEQGDNWGTR